MYSAVEYIRELCKQRKIAISTLEKECGFANGYLNPKKLKKIPYDRAIKIANYLNISIGSLFPDIETEKTPILSEKDERNGVNLIKIAGRDGSYTEKRVSDEQLALFQSMLDQMKPVDDDV